MMAASMEEDFWWYVCTVCHQAFNDDLRLRVHKRQAHPSVRSACALILSQAVDLNPNVKVIRCTADGLAIRFTPGDDDEPNEHKEHNPDPDSDLSMADYHDEEIEIKEEPPGRYYAAAHETSYQSCVITTNTDDKEASPEIETNGDPGLCKLELEPEAVIDNQIQAIQPDPIHINSTDDGGTNEFLQKLRPRRSLRVRNAAATFNQQSDPDSDDNHEAHGQPFNDSSDSTNSTSSSDAEDDETDSDWDRVQNRTFSRLDKQKRRRRGWITTSVWAREMLDTLSEKPGPFRCGLCCKLYLDLKSLKTHLTYSPIHIEHGDSMDKAVPCHCAACYKELYLLPTHEIATGEIMWQCKLCLKTLPENDVKKHVQVNHSNESMTVKAVQDLSASSDWRAAKLKLIMTPNKHANHRILNVEPIQRRSKVNDSNSKYECKYCGVSYSKRCLRTHIRETHGSTKSRKCSLCAKVFSTKFGLNLHQRRVHAITTKDHLCSTCGATFKSSVELKMHQRYHDPSNKTYECDVCGRSFFTSSVLNTHRRTHDTRSKMCPICGKMFKGGKDLRQHHKIWHTGEATRYKCDKCDAKYKTLLSLQRHAGAHVDGTPVECSQCPKRFKTTIHLNDHVRIVHLGKGQTGKLHFCRVCSQQFPGVVTVVQHELEAHNFQRSSIGTKYECDVCNKKFGKRFSFDQHQQSHSDVRNFKCDTCGEAFKSKGHLRQHESTHLSYEELPHVCETCGKRFGKPAQLRNHTQKIHDKAEAEKVTAVKRKRD